MFPVDRSGTIKENHQVVDHFLIHRRLELDRWLRLGSAQDSFVFFEELFVKTQDDGLRDDLGDHMLPKAEKRLKAVLNEIARTGTEKTIRSWPSAPVSGYSETDCHRSPVPLVASAVLAEALSHWLAPGVCDGRALALHRDTYVEDAGVNYLPAKSVWEANERASCKRTEHDLVGVQVVVRSLARVQAP